MSAALYLKHNFQCTQEHGAIPRLVINQYGANQLSDHLRALEVGAFVSFLGLVLLVALPTRRFGTLLGIVLAAVGLEYVAFFSQALAHQQYTVQITCFLPLKDVLWHACNVFVAVLAAEQTKLNSRFRKGLLVGVLVVLQHLPFEMVRGMVRVEDEYVNDVDFVYAHLKEKINGASAFFTIVLFVFGCSIGMIAATSKPSSTSELKSLICIPIFWLPLACTLSVPYYMAKYIGCVHFRASEPNFHAFHWRCARFSQMEDIPLLVLFTSVVGLLILSGLMMRSSRASAASIPTQAKMGILVSGWISDGIVLYCLVEGSDIPTLFLYSQVTLYLSVIVLKVGLLSLCLFSGSQASNVTHKDKED